MQDVPRRGFLKVLGGATFAAGTPLLGGCSAEFPAGAVALFLRRRTPAIDEPDDGLPTLEVETAVVASTADATD